MPDAGSDRQRGGWYDVVERVLKPDGKHSPLRLARPQGLVAAGAGHPRLPDPARHPRRRRVPAAWRAKSAAFYNAFFLDHDDGGVYFNVLANGMPYLLGNERFKGSHSMSGTTRWSCAILSAVYTNLLITKQPMDLLLQAVPGRLPEQHSAGLAGHPAAGQHPHRGVLDRRRAVHGLRRVRPDGEAARPTDRANRQGRRSVASLAGWSKLASR